MMQERHENVAMQVEINSETSEPMWEDSLGEIQVCMSFEPDEYNVGPVQEHLVKLHHEHVLKELITFFKQM